MLPEVTRWGSGAASTLAASTVARQEYDNSRVEATRAWARLMLRDIACPVVGFALLGYEAVYEHADRPWLILAALSLLGYPVADRIDRLLKGQGSGIPGNGTQQAKGGKNGNDEDPYSGPGGYYRS